MLRKLSLIGPILEVPNPNKPRRMWLPTWPYLVANYWARFCEKRRPIE